jgi:hypothetical protein
MAAGTRHTHDDPSSGDSGEGEPLTGPRRRCIASGEVHDKADLLRFVVAPDGTVVPDPAEKLPGRGIWCLPRRDMIERALRRRQFPRAARRHVSVPADLADQAAASLRQGCLARLGLARRSGEIVAGFEKVRSALASDRVGLLLEARDGAPDGREKVLRLARARPCDVAAYMPFTAVEQGAAVGREQAVHIAVLKGGHAERLQRDCQRLAGLTGDDPAGVLPVDGAAAAERNTTGDETNTEERTNESAGAR